MFSIFRLEADLLGCCWPSSVSGPLPPPRKMTGFLVLGGTCQSADHQYICGQISKEVSAVTVVASFGDVVLLVIPRCYAGLKLVLDSCAHIASGQSQSVSVFTG